MLWQTRLGYSFTIRYCIGIEKIATIFCESRSKKDLHDTMETEELFNTIRLSILG